ncbi:MAG: 5-oxoprolinase [Gammaproteobacteria bacterium]|nr:5-oxoprolinase [Gammaproteobacteria bacterium]
MAHLPQVPVLPAKVSSQGRWQFWIDRGGTFTDVVGCRPDGRLVSHKLLSESPEHYTDAALQGIRDLLGIATDAPLPSTEIEVIKMGTTVATNALLERKGEPTALVITAGFGDALRIGYQNRPDIFARHIVLPEVLYAAILEVPQRHSASGEERIPLDITTTTLGLQKIYAQGIRSLAIVFMHAYRFPEHEQQVGQLAREMGFEQISLSHEVSPLMKLVGRGDTTVVDAYLSPILRRYVNRVQAEMGETRLMFMQSNGGLIDANQFQGRNSILSGPAGGVIGAIKTCELEGINKVIGFDMGGTSTDVCHFAGELERSFETEVAGVRMRAPMMSVHTVAAGGGSILHFDGSRYRVGPDSAGANPGPACYRRGGPLTVTDCNLLLGRLLPDFFPQVFGTNGDQALNRRVAEKEFDKLAGQISTATGQTTPPTAVAYGFLQVAVENMAAAIKKISVQRGYDVSEYSLCCFGGAGGQHACMVADALGMDRILIHPLGGVLSAYGIGLADIRILRETAIEKPFDHTLLTDLNKAFDTLTQQAKKELEDKTLGAERVRAEQKLYLRYAGTDTPLAIDFSDHKKIIADFEAAHKKRFGFIDPDRQRVVESISVELIASDRPSDNHTITKSPHNKYADTNKTVDKKTRLYSAGRYHEATVYHRDRLPVGDSITGPAVIAEAHNTIIVECGWKAHVSSHQQLVLERHTPRPQHIAIGTQVDPVMLEIFNKLFMSIAEQMGSTLANTSYSVNIKERLDFSCALFDDQGALIANAPHVPVHLGSMGDSVQQIVDARRGTMRPGEVYVHNAPYKGGTHLPDITVITPVFYHASSEPVFFVASRGHHADIGGTAPGSMPANSQSIEEEGVLLDNVLLVEAGRLREQAILGLFTSGDYPARNPAHNMADLKAQIAANECGLQELTRMVDHYGMATIRAYMGHVQANAEESVRRVIDYLEDGHFSYAMDNGSSITVTIRIDHKNRNASIDFTGTSEQQADNFNAPASICKAAVLYVFRSLVDDDIPLNAGCLKPLRLIIPSGSMLRPVYPAAVAAGNVETSQCIVDTLYGALGVMAAAQGSMNNFTFGNKRWQYYETLCGGTGASTQFDGCDAVQSHMTNSRLTDPEILEWRFPVLLEEFSIRQDSGGRGQHCGGNGTRRRLRFLEPMTAAILSNRRKIPPTGLKGGGPGQAGHNYIERADGNVEQLGYCAQTQMQAGDVFVIETPGGGGYGSVGE